MRFRLVKILCGLYGRESLMTLCAPETEMDYLHKKKQLSCNREGSLATPWSDRKLDAAGPRFAMGTVDANGRSEVYST